MIKLEYLFKMCFTSVGAQLYGIIYANLDESETKIIFKYMQDVVYAAFFFFFFYPKGHGGNMNIFLSFGFIICHQHYFSDAQILEYSQNFVT